MALDLRFAAAERDEHREGEQLARAEVEAGAGEVVAEAVGRQESLNVLLVVWRRRVELRDGVLADDLRLHLAALLGARLGCGAGLTGQRQLDSAVGEYVVGGMQEVEYLAHAHVRDGLVDDLLGLDRSDADGQCRTEHGPLLDDRVGGDQRGELHHQPRPGVELALAEYLAEREVVEAFDQFGVVCARVETGRARRGCAGLGRWAASLLGRPDAHERLDRAPFVHLSLIHI